MFQCFLVENVNRSLITGIVTLQWETKMSLAFSFSILKQAQHSNIKICNENNILSPSNVFATWSLHQVLTSIENSASQ